MRERDVEWERMYGQIEIFGDEPALLLLVSRMGVSGIDRIGSNFTVLIISYSRSVSSC